MNRLYHPPVVPRSANLDRGTWGRKYTDVSVRASVMSVKILVLGIFFVSIFMLTIALIMGFEFPKYVRTKITEDQCITDNIHPKYERWREGELWTRKNRIYYMALENEWGFLYHGETPKVKQKGPYVYTEYEIKYDVVFNLQEIYFKTRRIHEFDARLTSAECGEHCSEHDQLTLLNPHFLSQTSSLGSEKLYVISKIPSVVNESLTLIGINMDGSNTSSIEVTGCLDVACDCKWNACGVLYNISDLGSVSFGFWLRKNDTAYKSVILNDRQGISFPETSMLGLYNVILHSELLYGRLPFDQASCQKWSEYIACASADLPTSSSVSDYETNCGIVPLLQVFQKQGTSCLANFTAVLNKFLCKEDSRCFNISGDYAVASAYVHSLVDFILSQLGVFVHEKNFLEHGLVITRKQSDFAVGYIFDNVSKENVYVYGILNDHWTGAPGIVNPLWKMASCLENRNVNNNMAVREFNGSQFAPKKLLRSPGSVAYVSGHSDFVSTCGKLKACVSCRVPVDRIGIFVPELWRSVVFVSKLEISLFDVTLYRYYLANDTFIRDGAYPVSSGLQNMTGLYGYLSWRSNPLFDDLSSPHSTYFINQTDREKHLSYVDVEPQTGRIWQKKFRFQFNVGVTTTDIDAPKTHPLNVTYLGQPIPVYWVERSMLITQDEVDYFNFKVTRLMRVACGGVIGMSVVAFIVLILCVVVCFYPAKMNRVEPVTEETSQNQTNKE